MITNKLKKWLIAAAFILILTSGLSALSPDETLSEYFSFLKKGEYEKAYTLHTPQERREASLELFKEYLVIWDEALKNSRVKSPVFYKFIYDAYLKYNILSKRKIWGGYIYELEISRPKLFDIGMDMEEEVPGLTRAGEPDEELELAVAAAIQKLYPGGAPVETEKTTYRLVRISSGYKISTGLPDTLLPLRILKIRSKANTAREAGELNKAQALFMQALAMDPDNQMLKNAVQSVTELLEIRDTRMDEDPDPYISGWMALEDPAIDESEGVNLGFKLRNNGDKTLTGITVRILFLTEKGKVLDAFTFDIQTVSLTSPLEPGEVRDISELLFYYPTAESWKGRGVQAEIVGFRTD